MEGNQTYYYSKSEEHEILGTSYSFSKLVLFVKVMGGCAKITYGNAPDIVLMGSTDQYSINTTFNGAQKWFFCDSSDVYIKLVHCLSSLDDCA